MHRLLVTLAGLVPAAAVGTLHAQSPDRYTLAGNRIAVYNLAGTVSVGPGAGTDVTIEVQRAGAAGRRLTVETGRIDGSETLRVIYPDGPVRYDQESWRGRTEMQVRDDGTFGHGWDGHRGERGRRVRIESRGSGTDAHANLRVMIPAGREVAIFLGVGRIQASNISGTIRLDASSGNIATEQMKGSLHLDTGSGDILASAVDLTELNIDTGSGDVRMTGARATHLTVDTGSGNVAGTGITAADLSVDTGSGDIELRGVRARSLNMDTGSGSVLVALEEDTDEIVVDTGSGDVTIMVPPGFGSAVDLSTNSGEVETEVEIQVTRRGRQRLAGRIGDGQGRLTIETGSGDVTIRAAR